MSQVASKSLTCLFHVFHHMTFKMPPMNAVEDFLSFYNYFPCLLIQQTYPQMSCNLLSKTFHRSCAIAGSKNMDVPLLEMFGNYLFPLLKGSSCFVLKGLERLFGCYETCCFCRGPGFCFYDP